MKVTELTKKICDDYPKVWNKLKNKYNNRPVADGCLIYDFDHGIVSFCYPDYPMKNYLIYDQIPFYLLYGLLDSFFRGYKIYIAQFFEDGDWEFVLLVINKSIQTNDVYEKFQEQAILKACEILNNKE